MIKVTTGDFPSIPAFGRTPLHPITPGTFPSIPAFGRSPLHSPSPGTFPLHHSWENLPLHPPTLGHQYLATVQPRVTTRTVPGPDIQHWPTYPTHLDYPLYSFSSLQYSEFLSQNITLFLQNSKIHYTYLSLHQTRNRIIKENHISSSCLTLTTRFAACGKGWPDEGRSTRGLFIETGARLISSLFFCLMISCWGSQLDRATSA